MQRRVPAFIAAVLLTLVLPLGNLALAEGSGRQDGRDEAKPKHETPERAQEGQSVRMVVTAYYMPDPKTKDYERKKRLNGPGHTSSGAPLETGIAAANIARFPFGTELSVPGYGTVVVKDTMGSGKSDLDIFVGNGMEAESRALQWGKRHLTVRVIKKPAKKPGKRSLPLIAEASRGK